MFCSGMVSVATTSMCFKVSALSVNPTAQHTALLEYLKFLEGMLNLLIGRMDVSHLHPLETKLRIRSIGL
jgi:hypothetical protein